MKRHSEIKKPWEYYDFFHDPYKPVIPPRGKSSSDVLLHNSLLRSAHQKVFLSILGKIRHAIGPWNTVWGVKLEHGSLTWELYFYNRQFVDWRKAMTGVLKALRSYFEIPVFVEDGIERQPYFMFSVDLNDGIFKSKQIDGVHLYMEGRSGMPQGSSYYWSNGAIRFENYYNLFLMPREIKHFIQKIRHGVVLEKYHVPFLKHDLVRRLMPCYRTGFADKQNKDGLYFSRVNILQLLYFLEHFSYPDHIVDFIRSHKEKLDHLLYDVAFDCTLGPQGPVFSKSSYYSLF